MRSLKCQQPVTAPEIPTPIDLTGLELSQPKNTYFILPPEPLLLTSIPHIKHFHALKAILRVFHQTPRIHVDAIASCLDLPTPPILKEVLKTWFADCWWWIHPSIALNARDALKVQAISALSGQYHRQSDYDCDGYENPVIKNYTTGSG